MADTDSSSFATASELLRWAETLSGIARTGLGFTQSLYERERFEEVLKVASDIRAAASDEAESDALFEEWLETFKGRAILGSVDEVAAQLREYERAGCDRVMLQHLNHRDLESVRLIGRELAPALA